MVALNPLTRSGAGPSDAALVIAARAREAWAQEALFRRYATMVNGLAFRLLGRDADLDDLVQDCFAEAWISLHRLENPGAFGSWLGSIVVRTSHKLLRRRKILSRLGLRRGMDVDLDQVVSHTASPEVEAELRAIYRRLDSWPTSTRVAFVLRRIEGMPIDQIAEFMKISIATVKRRVADGERWLNVADTTTAPGPAAVVSPSRLP